MNRSALWLRVLARRLTAVTWVTLLVGCASTGPDLELVQVSGAVTSGGQPVTGPAVITLGVTGSDDPVAFLNTTLAGTYGITGQLDSSDCGSLFVSVFLTNPLGQVVAQVTETLGSCGTHVVDLAIG